MASIFLTVGAGLVAWPLLASSLPSLFSQAPFDQSSYADIITPQLSTFIEQTLALENITGLSVAIIQKYGEPEFHTWGYRTEDQDPMTPDTLFHIASVSKAFCATALGLLIDDFANGNNVTALPPGVIELTWHTRLKDVLPDWQLMDEWASERANLRDILSHVSGMPRHDTSYGPLDTPDEMIRRLRYLQPAFELREHWSYNNIMYMVAAHVIETYSGQPYTSFVEERIFTPIGMTSSTYSPAKAEMTGKFTQGWTKGGRRLPEFFTEDSAALLLAGAAGVISSAVDMAKWISTWIGKGVHGNQTVIPLSVYQNVSYSYSICVDHPVGSPDAYMGDSVAGYGMGWFRSSYRGHDIVNHGGSLPGVSTLVSFLPNDEIGVAVFANGHRKDEAVMTISKHILDSALHLTDQLTPIRSPPVKIATADPGYDPEGPMLSLDVFAGMYTNPGYGSFTLCAPSTTSSYCTNVRSNFTVIDDVQGISSPFGDLVAEWPRVAASHVRMRVKGGALFDLYLTTLYPNGYGKDQTPFELGGIETADGLVEFVVDDGEVVGFGLSGLVGELTEQARTCETARDCAEVWFDKV